MQSPHADLTYLYIFLQSYCKKKVHFAFLSLSTSHEYSLHNFDFALWAVFQNTFFSIH